MNSHPIINASPLQNSSTTAKNSALTDSYQININDITTEKEIGKGTYGSVFIGKWKNSTVAIKKTLLKDIDDKRADSERIIIQELTDLHAPNLVKLLGYYIDYSDADTIQYHLVMEYFSSTTLANLIDRHIMPSNLVILAAMMQNIMLAVYSIHEFNYLHGDIKPENILVSERHTIKLCDFNLSSKGELKDQSAGTPAWAAPEIFNGQFYTRKSDIYSSAMVFWSMIASKRPYFGMPSFQIGYNVGTDNHRESIPDTCPLLLRLLITLCWNKDPNNRPDAKQLLNELHDSKTFNLKSFKL